MTFQMKSNYFDPLTGCCSTQPSCLLYYLIYLEKKTAILCSFSSSLSRTNQQKKTEKKLPTSQGFHLPCDFEDS